MVPAIDWGGLGCVFSTGGAAACGAKAAVKVVTSPVVSFAVDPMGYLASELQRANESLAKNALPRLVEVLHPDLSAGWFIEAYKVSFAVGVIVWGALLGWEFVQHARKRIGPDQVMETLIQYTPMFFVGAAFGPMVGNLLLRMVGALSDSIIAWGGQGMGGDIATFTTLITSTRPGTMVGGNALAILLFALMMVAFVLVLFGLLFMYVTLYISGTVFPLGWAWITRSENREHGWKIARVWLGVLAAQPLMFFALHVAMAMAGAGLLGDVGSGKSGGLAQLVGLTAGAVALLMVTFTPFAAAKMMPVGPTQSSASGPSMHGWGGKGGQASSFGRGGAGGDSASDSQMAQASRGSGGQGTATGGSMGAAEAGGSQAAGSGAAASGGGAALAAAGGVGLAAIAAKEAGGRAKQVGQQAAQAGAQAADNAGGGAGGEPGAAGGPSGSGAGSGTEAGSGERGSTSQVAAASDAPRESAGVRDGGGTGGAGLHGSAPSGGDTAAARGAGGGGGTGGAAGRGSRGASRPPAAATSGFAAAAGKLGAGVNSLSDLAALVGQQTTVHMDHQHPDQPRSRR